MTRTKLKSILLTCAVFAAIMLCFLITMNLVIRNRENAKEQSSLRAQLSSALQANTYEELSYSEYKDNYPEIDKLYVGYDEDKQVVGYVILAEVETDNGSVSTLLGFSDDGNTLLQLAVQSTGLDEVIHSQFISDTFEDQFAGISLPVALSVDIPDTSDSEELYPAIEGLVDGTYHAMEEDADTSGYQDYVDIVVSGGRIVSVVWDAIQTDGGTNRAAASVNGEYELDDNTIIWAEQAYAMQNKLIEVQSPEKIAVKSDGTTEVVPNVTIDVNTFLILAEDCIDDAKVGDTASSQNEEEEEGTQESQVEESTSGAVETETTETVTQDDELSADEDGYLGDSANLASANYVDGILKEDIQTKVQEVSGETDISRTVISTINRSYLFLLDYLEG